MSDRGTVRVYLGAALGVGKTLTNVPGAGVGLGLAMARGFIEAMHDTLALDETPGGGLTAAQ